MVYCIHVFFALLAVLNQGNLAKKLVHSKSGNGKIIGGNNVTAQEFPYQAYLRISQLGDEEHKYHQCGGSIISAHFILSAAHCFINATNVQARIGSAEASTGGRIYHSAYLTTHPKYNSVTKDYDIGVMKTTKKMHLDGVKTKTITLVERKTLIPPGSMVTISGWGRVASDGPLSPVLKAVELPTLSNEDCNEKLGGFSNRQMCAALEDGSEDFCKVDFWKSVVYFRGDSGGPAVLTSSKIQVGIVSASYGCAIRDSPSILANVTNMRDWIYMNTGV